MKKFFLFQLLIFCVIANTHAQKKEIVARTPPMGWNSWNKFSKQISEQLIREITDAMVSSGMKEAGYEYIVIDDLWQLGRIKGDSILVQGRDKQGKLIADPAKFPNGMKAVGDYIHSKGLKFGLYTSPGLSTCGEATGSLDYEEIDAKTFAEWGVDFVKLDKCSFKGDINTILPKWRKILDNIERPILLSVNAGRVYDPKVIYASANMWRTTSDIREYWSKKPDNVVQPSITEVIEQHEKMSNPQGPSAWNDADMMQVGNGKLTFEENKSHFYMWALFGAPLMAGNDIRKMTPVINSLLTNSEVIAVNQDPLGFKGTKIVDNGNGLQIWAKKLHKYSDYAIVILNQTENNASITFNKNHLNLKSSFFVRDIGERKDLGYYTDSLQLLIAPHGSSILKISVNESPIDIQSITKQELFDKELKLEAEDAVSSEMFFLSKENSGYSGKGFMSGKNHSWVISRIIWKVISKQEKNSIVEFRYSNSEKEPLQFTLNDKDVTFPVTKKGEWSIIQCPFKLLKDENVIMLRSKHPGKNTLDLDYIRLYLP